MCQQHQHPWYWVPKCVLCIAGSTQGPGGTAAPLRLKVKACVQEGDELVLSIFLPVLLSLAYLALCRGALGLLLRGALPGAGREDAGWALCPNGPGNQQGLGKAAVKGEHILLRLIHQRSFRHNGEASGSCNCPFQPQNCVQLNCN